MKETNKTVLVALITGIFALLAASIQLLNHPTKDKTVSFTGIVEQDDGTSISSARVMAIADQTLPQTVFTDGNGAFNLSLSAETKALQLDIEAAGFEAVRLYPNIHRTGAEEIVLQRNKRQALGQAHEQDSGIKKNQKQLAAFSLPIPIIWEKGSTLGRIPRQASSYPKLPPIL